MDMLSVVTVLLLFGVIIVASVIYQNKRAEQRRRELSAVARRLGFSFDPSPDSSHDERYARFAVFRRGHSRVALNTMLGEIEIDAAAHHVVAGDFRYRITRRNGKSSSTSTHRFSYLILHLPTPAVPDLLIRPEGVFDKIGQALGFDDVDFEDVEFSRRFVVKSSDRRFAYDVCHPHMIEWLKTSANRFPAIDMEAGQLCLATDNRRWTPEQFEQHLAFARDFIDRWPEHLRRDLGWPSATREIRA